MNKKFLAHLTTCLVIFLLMHLALPSMFNDFTARNFSSVESDSYLQRAFDYHATGLNGLFKKRVFVTNALSILSNFFNLSISMSMYLLQSFLFVCCLSILYFATPVIHSKNKVLNLYLFTLSFTVFFAFFKPIYAWDDLAQYFFLFLSIYLIQQKNLNLPLLFGSLLFALLARETSILTLPGFVLLIYFRHPTKLVQSLFFLASSCISYYLIIHLSIGFADMSGRWEHYIINFKNKKKTIETLCYLYVVLFLPLILSLKKYKQKDLTPFVYSFFITFIINTPIVLLAALAREARLFALPLIFIWPVYSVLISDLTWKNIKDFALKYKLYTFLILALSVLIKNIFRPHPAPALNAFREYILFYSLIFLFFFFKYGLEKLKTFHPYGQNGESNGDVNPLIKS